MTTWKDIDNNPNYIKVLDHGFVGLLDHMGSDSDIANSARVSYGAGTKTVRQDRGLIRYLVKHLHTSPIEMGEIKFHIKLPIFVERQLIRHRTANVNQLSARYSVLPNEFYVPDLQVLKPQSKVNNQGRGGEFDVSEAVHYQTLIRKSCEQSYETYKELIGSEEEPKVARELARGVLPVNFYTEIYWKQDLKNLLHLIKLRADKHAQWEIQQYAQAIYDLIQPLYPAVVEAFEDYWRGSTSISRDEKELLKAIMSYNGDTFSNKLDEMVSMFESEKAFLTEWGLSKREFTEFKETWSNIL